MPHARPHGWMDEERVPLRVCQSWIETLLEQKANVEIFLWIVETQMFVLCPLVWLFFLYYWLTFLTTF